MDYAQVTNEAWPEFTPAPVVQAKWTWDMRKVILPVPVGAKVRYWWTIEDKSGNKLTTAANEIRFDDLRYAWKSLTQGQLTLFWYSGNQSFAKDLMSASQAALERLANDTGVYLNKPVSIYAYSSQQDLLGAMVFPREWTGGEARPDYGIIIIAIAPGDMEGGEGGLSHELGHLVTHQVTFGPYGALLPTWLDEGLAMHAQGKPEPYLQSVLKAAFTYNKLISVRSLSSAFSARTEEALLSYAESQSLIEFLIQNYGKDKMLRLLNKFPEGNTTDDALTEVYGFDQDGLDKLWRESLAPAKPKVQSEKKELQTASIGLSLTNPVYIDNAYSSHQVIYEEIVYSS
jgi:hypothetical protein